MTVTLVKSPVVTALPTIDHADASLLASSYVIATFETRNSRYTLVRRHSFVMVVKDGDRNGRSTIVKAGVPIVGTMSTVEAQHHGEHVTYVLRVWDDNGRMQFQSSAVESVFFLEN